jgi:hypothetical protein
MLGEAQNGGAARIPSHAEQLAAFKTEKGVGPRDIVVAVVFTFDA